MKRSLLVVAACVALGILGCSDRSSPTPAAESQEPPTATAPPATATPPTVTGSAAAPLPTASPTAAPGLEVAQRLAAAVSVHDVAAVRSMLRLVQTPCTEQQGMGGPPKCWSDGSDYKQGNVPPEGTIVEVFPISGCEFGWYQGAALERIVAAEVDRAGELYAIVRLSRPLFEGTETDYPKATHAVIFTRNFPASGVTDQAIVFAVDDAGLTFVDFPCVLSARDTLAQHPRYRDAEIVVRGPAFGR